MERQRVKQDLHDGPQQQLSSLLMQLEVLEDQPELAQQLLGRLTESTKISLLQMRAAIHGPGVIAEGLEQEVEKATLALQAAGIQLFHKVVGAPWKLTAVEVYNLAAIIREGLANVQKHAGVGTVVLLFLHFGDDQLEVEIADTGQGFDLDKIQAGAGLQNMRERAGKLHSHLEISSEPGRGTTIRLVVPRSS